MNFVRKFDTGKIAKLTGASAELYARLKADVLAGVVFPAVRKNRIDFYYKGGCLYSFNGTEFKRNPDYDKMEYSKGTEGLDDYEKAKKQCENKFTSKKDQATERQLLDRLNSHTFAKDSKSHIVVLDIEVCLGGNTKKCDMVLLDTREWANQILFVEGKVFSDKRVNRAVGHTPEVIEQVQTYSRAIAEQRENIAKQYSEHIKTINELFGTKFNPQVHVDKTAKLVVFEMPTVPNDNTLHSIKTIEDELGANNVAWFKIGEEPTLDKIWNDLTYSYKQDIAEIVGELPVGWKKQAQLRIFLNEVCWVPRVVNFDFADISNSIRGGREIEIVAATAKGENRLTQALTSALDQISNIDTANNLMVSIECSWVEPMQKVHETMQEVLRKSVNPRCNIHFTCNMNDKFGDECKVTLVPVWR